MSIEKLQQYWNQTANEFEEQVQAACGGRSSDEQIPGRQARHHASDVFGDLDRCSADESAGANFSYGELFGIANAAEALGVQVERWFPK